jgi:hypothetical protein
MVVPLASTAALHLSGPQQRLPERRRDETSQPPITPIATVAARRCRRTVAAAAASPQEAFAALRREKRLPNLLRTHAWWGIAPNKSSVYLKRVSHLTARR